MIVARGIRSFASAASSVTNALVLELVANTSEGFGRQRTFGTVSWGLGSVLVGYIIDAMGLQAGVFFFSYFGEIVVSR